MSVPSANSRNVERMCTAVWGINHFYLLNKKSAEINSGKKISTRYYPVDIFMDLAGIEPASESLFIEASPITVAVLTFPRVYAHRQAYNLSSFMIHLPGQSLPGKVSHIVDARPLKCECIRADEQQLGC